MKLAEPFNAEGDYFTRWQMCWHRRLRRLPLVAPGASGQPCPARAFRWPTPAAAKRGLGRLTETERPWGLCPHLWDCLLFHFYDKKDTAAMKGRVRGSAGGLVAGTQMSLVKYTRTPFLLQPPRWKAANRAVTLLENERIGNLAGGHNGFTPSWLYSGFQRRQPTTWKRVGESWAILACRIPKTKNARCPGITFLPLRSPGS